jgi:hypothetical protein
MKSMATVDRKGDPSEMMMMLQIFRLSTGVVEELEVEEEEEDEVGKRVQEHRDQGNNAACNRESSRRVGQVVLKDARVSSTPVDTPTIHIIITNISYDNQ